MGRAFRRRSWRFTDRDDRTFCTKIVLLLCPPSGGFSTWGPSVDDLLSKVIKAHGGPERWDRFGALEATIVADGAFWGVRDLTQDRELRRVKVWSHGERSTFQPFGGPDWHCVFTPDRVAILKGDGTVVADRNDPRAPFSGHEVDALGSTAFGIFRWVCVWTYLSTPFLLATGEVSEEGSWTEGGETWRVQRARFPDAMATDSTVQDFFFGDDFLLRRHDYSVDVAGSFDAAHL
jgi:hypothetical protein